MNSGNQEREPTPNPSLKGRESKDLWKNPVAMVSTGLLTAAFVGVAMSAVRSHGATPAKHAASMVHQVGFKSHVPEQPLDPSLEPGDNLVPEKYRPTVMLKAREEFEQERGYKFNKIVRGSKGKKLIALTFDDGPHGEYTVQLLDVLKETHTPATFFLVGKQVDKYPGLVQLEVMQGHQLGNHTYDHVDLTQIPPELIGFELDECDKAIKRAVGVSPRFFRPPGGDYDLNVIREATRRSYVTSLWTDDPGDYAKPGADVVLQRTLDRLENGAIILLHDGIPETVSILPALIAESRKRGYEFVTISELAKQR